jgi:hypothetical protein
MPSATTRPTLDQPSVSFDRRTLHSWLAGRAKAMQADTWTEIAERISRLGHWQFEDYRR